MSGFDQSSIAVSMPTVVGADAALGGPYKIKPSEAFSGALMTVSGLTGETISVETSPDGYWGAPANPSFYRTDWRGTSLLYPTARTNSILQSQTFQTSWVPSGVLAFGSGSVADAATAPDGTLTADKIVETATTAIHTISQSVTNAQAQYTFSVYLKAAERTWAFVLLSDGLTGVVGARINLATGEVTADAFTAGSWTGRSISSVSAGNGWWKVSCSGTRGAGTVCAGFVYISDGVATSSGTAYAGNGASGIYVWGAQLETGAASTPYIPTTTTAVTITDYTLSNGVITLAEVPVTGATLSYDNSVLPSPYYIFATGDGVRTQFAYDGVWGTLTANSGKGNGIWQIDLRGAQAYRLVKSAGSETATVNMTLKRDALQYKNTAGTWSVT